MFPKIKIKNKSFTIVELLIVIGVIAIVATLVYIAASPAVTRSESLKAFSGLDIFIKF